MNVIPSNKLFLNLFDKGCPYPQP